MSSEQAAEPKYVEHVFCQCFIASVDRFVLHFLHLDLKIHHYMHAVDFIHRV